MFHRKDNQNGNVRNATAVECLVSPTSCRDVGCYRFLTGDDFFATIILYFHLPSMLILEKIGKATACLD